jgi:hypothetical protein
MPGLIGHLTTTAVFPALCRFLLRCWMFSPGWGELFVYDNGCRTSFGSSENSPRHWAGAEMAVFVVAEYSDRRDLLPGRG